MKNYFIELIKDLVISILIIICIIIVLSIIFYDKTAITRVIPESEEYFLTEEMEEKIEESNIEEAEEIIVSYYLDAGDLKKYEKNNEYIKGKSNPFSMTSESPDSENINSASSNASKGFYENDGTK